MNTNQYTKRELDSAIVLMGVAKGMKPRHIRKAGNISARQYKRLTRRNRKGDANV